MSTPRAKRALVMGTTPVAKRSRMVTRSRAVGRVYNTKPEMKFKQFVLSHTAVTNSNLDLSEIASGAEEQQRVGNKIKYWHVEAIIQSALPVRVELLMPSITGNAPTHFITALTDSDQFQVLGEAFLNPNLPVTVSDIFKVSFKLPLGIVSKWDGPLAGDIAKHQLFLRLNTGGSTTITGTVRVWYTDA